MSIIPTGGSWEKSLDNDAIWKGTKIFCPAGSARLLNKHSSMDLISKSGSVGRSKNNCFSELNKFRFAVSGDLITLGRNECFNLFHIHLVKVGIGRCSNG